MDGVRIDGSRREVAWEDATVALAPREASALAALVADPGAPVGSADLARCIWPGNAMVSTYDLCRVIHQLRLRLRSAGIPLTIRTVHGRGYFLEPDHRA